MLSWCPKLHFFFKSPLFRAEQRRKRRGAQVQGASGEPLKCSPQIRVGNTLTGKATMGFISRIHCYLQADWCKCDRLHIGTSSSILRIKLLWQNVSLGRTLPQIEIRTKGASNQIFFDNNRIMNKVTWKQAVLDGCHLDSGLSKALTNPNCCSTSTKSKSAHSSNNLETSSRANLQVVQHNNTGLWFELFPLMVSAMHFGP